MSRKKTIDDKKNRRDLLMMSIEEKKKALQPSIEALEKLNREFAEEAEKALSERKDLFYELCAPVFGSHTTEKEVKEWFKKIMTSERNKGAVEALKQLEANHVKEIEEHEAERINALKEKLEKRYKRKADDQSDSDSDEILEDENESEKSKT
ncbi:MAG: hypothetical protein K6B74_02590 [Ruminococcus sp.]|nr:hypothetical protein [Ruminococcus sp.]